MTTNVTVKDSDGNVKEEAQRERDGENGVTEVRASYE